MTFGIADMQSWLWAVELITKVAILSAGKTIEFRRSEAADAQGKSDSSAQLRRLFYTSTEDRNRAHIGLPPMPKPVIPPPPPSEERTKEILADDRVQVHILPNSART